MIILDKVLFINTENLKNINLRDRVMESTLIDYII